jgi:hypothetical protein
MRGRRSLLTLLGTIVAFASLQACGMSHVSSVSAPGPKVSVRTIAIMPGGGLLADAVAVELMNRGFTIIDAASTSNMMIRLNLNEVEIARPEGLAKFKGQGIEALLVVRGAGGYDEQPQSASARMTSTADGRLLAGTTWQNGFGGQAGSIADRVMRQGLTQAASQIAGAIAKQIG